MNESRLAAKISICQSLDKLNENACGKVIELMIKELGFSNKREFARNLLFCSNTYTNYTNENRFCNKSLATLATKCKEIAAVESNISNSKCDTHYTPIQDTSSGSNNEIDILFPLFDLPIDTIWKCATFLDKKDIFSFEQCCRDLYSIINNLSFLSQTNTFKEFTIDDKMLVQIGSEKYDLFKYSRTKELNFNLTNFTTMWAGFYQLWQLYSRSNIYYSDWFFNLLTSITHLSFTKGTYSTYLLDVLPIDILFDPQKSQLEYLLVHDANNIDPSYGKEPGRGQPSFPQKYKQLLQDMKKNGLKQRALTAVLLDADGRLSIEWNHCFDMKHLMLTDTSIDLNYFKNCVKYHPNLESLVICNQCDIIDDQKSVSIDPDVPDIVKSGAAQLNIRTLKLIYCYDENTFSHFLDKKLNTMSQINMDSSLRHLTIVFVPRENFDCNKMGKQLTDIVQRNIFYNLNELILLIECDNELISIVSDWIKTVFNVLISQLKTIKDQHFSQLCLGCLYTAQSSDEYCNVFSLQCDHDKDDNLKFLQLKNKEWLQMINESTSFDEKQLKKCQHMRREYSKFFYI